MSAFYFLFFSLEKTKNSIAIEMLLYEDDRQVYRIREKINLSWAETKESKESNEITVFQS